MILSSQTTFKEKSRGRFNTVPPQGGEEVCIC